MLARRNTLLQLLVKHSSQYQRYCKLFTDVHDTSLTLHSIYDFRKVLIKAGFFSSVYKVRHSRTGEQMVLKLNQLSTNKNYLIRETEIMNKLNHPNVLKLVGLCVSDRQLFPLTEYMPGGTLEEVIAVHHITIRHKQKVQLALDISSGMSYIHAIGIIHRDLASKNVLLKLLPNNKYRAIISDFGLAIKAPDTFNRRLGMQPKYYPVAGSPYWMSPECIFRHGYDCKTDVFSYGIILCELIARISAEPSIMPRSMYFGLDYIHYATKCKYDVCSNLLKIAFDSCIFKPSMRPTFRDITEKLKVLLNSLSNRKDGDNRPIPKINLKKIRKLATKMSIKDKFYEPIQFDENDDIVNPFDNLGLYLNRSHLIGTTLKKRDAEMRDMYSSCLEEFEPMDFHDMDYLCGFSRLHLSRAHVRGQLRRSKSMYELGADYFNSATKSRNSKLNNSKVKRNTSESTKYLKPHQAFGNFLACYKIPIAKSLQSKKEILPIKQLKLHTRKLKRSLNLHTIKKRAPKNNREIANTPLDLSEKVSTTIKTYLMESDHYEPWDKSFIKVIPSEDELSANMAELLRFFESSAFIYGVKQNFKRIKTKHCGIGHLPNYPYIFPRSVSRQMRAKGTSPSRLNKLARLKRKRKLIKSKNEKVGNELLLSAKPETDSDIERKLDEALKSMTKWTSESVLTTISYSSSSSSSSSSSESESEEESETEVNYDTEIEVIVACAHPIKKISTEAAGAATTEEQFYDAT